MAKNLATRYTEAMKEHPYGYALFRPALSTTLRPGSCGYIDDNGRWNRILLDIQATTNEGFSASTSLSAMPTQYHTWGPKASSGVVQRRVAFDGGADALAAGFPAEVKVALNFSTTNEFGAILHCQKSSPSPDSTTASLSRTGLKPMLRRFSNTAEMSETGSFAW